MDNNNLRSPHVLLFPFPVQGRINCMLKLAELLCHGGLYVTFLNSDLIHKRLLHCTNNILTYFAQYPHFYFETISDGLPADHPRTGDRVIELFNSMNAVVKPRFRDKLVSGGQWHDGKPPITCVIADGIMSFAIDVAKEFRIPTILFRTISATCFWAFFCVPKLIEDGKLPLNGNIQLQTKGYSRPHDFEFCTLYPCNICFCITSSTQNSWKKMCRRECMDGFLSSMAGLESFRFRDLPSFCRTRNVADPSLQVCLFETQQTLGAYGLLLNTFEELEEPSLTQIRSHIPNLYTVGTLHANLKTRVASQQQPYSSSSSSLWEEDRSCIAWLDSQVPRSVVYMSFGSMTVMTKDQLVEFWYGLVNSGSPFLWVIRPNSVESESNIPVELLETTRKRGYMVGWAPLEEVLSHPAIGGFLTLSGWNSTLECLYEGVPMICWPFYADQQVNSRLVGEIWKVGLDMKDTCDRVIVEKRIGELMEVRKGEFMKCAKKMANLAKRSVGKGGSSYNSLDRLINDIKLMSLGNLVWLQDPNSDH